MSTGQMRPCRVALATSQDARAWAKGVQVRQGPEDAKGGIGAGEGDPILVEWTRLRVLVCGYSESWQSHYQTLQAYIIIH